MILWNVISCSSIVNASVSGEPDYITSYLSSTLNIEAGGFCELLANSTKLHGITSQKTTTVTAMKTSHLIDFIICS
jgi:hypothetical protein